jgi:hypothetical protein
VAAGHVARAAAEAEGADGGPLETGGREGHYEPMPPQVQQQIVSQYKPKAEEE